MSKEQTHVIPGFLHLNFYTLLYSLAFIRDISPLNIILVHYNYRSPLVIFTLFFFFWLRKHLFPQNQISFPFFTQCLFVCLFMFPIKWKVLSSSTRSQDESSLWPSPDEDQISHYITSITYKRNGVLYVHTLSNNTNMQVLGAVSILLFFSRY